MSGAESLLILQFGLCALQWTTRGATDGQDQLCVYHAGHTQSWHLSVHPFWIDLTTNHKHTEQSHTVNCCHLKV